VRVFLFTAPSANHRAIPDSKVWINNLSRGLSALRLEVLQPSFDTHQHMLECMGDVAAVDMASARTKYSELLVRDVRQAYQRYGVDLLVAYVWNIHVTPEAIHEIRALGIPTVLFYCNAAHQFHQVAQIAPHFDYCMVPERQALPKYRAVGANPLHIQMAADPLMYRPYEEARYYDASFVGQMYLNRPEYIAYLSWHGINMRVWGPGWQDTVTWARSLPYHRKIRRAFGQLKQTTQRRLHVEPSWYPLPYQAFGGILSDEAMVRIPSQSRISLNFSEVKDELTGEIKRHIRLRDFEVPMSGGLLLTGYQDELAEYYDIGREIVCYDSKVELLDQCRYYLSHPQQAETIRKAGHQRARRNHTWGKRFQLSFDLIGVAIPVATTG